MNELAFEVELNASYPDALEKVSQCLKAEGFGILTRIDIDKAFKEKIGETFRPYAILGACNPHLAHRALSKRADLGLMLPCNVTVEQIDPTHCTVRIVNPQMMMAVGNLGDDDTIKAVAAEAYERLHRVAAALA
jgi:uncharacterized protein (DUF302 family)